MKLVEAESEGPVEGDAALITPPRPPHRRVSVSLLFTLSVLIGTVVTIYEVFPARDNVLVTEAIARHRDQAVVWDLPTPTPTELRAWAIGVVGKDVPLPQASVPIVGARRIDIFNRHAALIRLQLASGDQVTYLVQHARGIAPDHNERVDGDIRAIAWRRGAFTCIGVGPDASAKTWLALLGGT